MREIKFRGKSLCDDQWVYGDLIHKRHDIGAVMIQDSKGLGSDVAPQTVGQFTGLLDKNDNEIWEGDIVLFNDYRYKVLYDDIRYASFFLISNGSYSKYFFGEKDEL